MICSVCQLDKDPSAFSANTSSGSPRTKCKQCRADEQRERRQKKSPVPVRRYRTRAIPLHDPDEWWQPVRKWPWPAGYNVFGGTRS